jgi:hypothetical protein
MLGSRTAHCGRQVGMDCLRRRMWYGVINLGLLSAALVATGGSGTEASWIAHDESVVVLESPQFHFDWDHRRLPLHIDLFHCATDTLHSKYPRIHLITQSEFVKQAFPNLEPNAAPISPESLRTLVGNETWRARIAPLNVRYLVYGATENDIETVSEGFDCIGGPAAAVCGGLGKWKKRSSYNLLVVDLKQHHESRRSGATSGKSWFAMLVPLFVGWKSPTEERTCTRLGRDVLELLEQAPIPTASEEATPR